MVRLSDFSLVVVREGERYVVQFTCDFFAYQKISESLGRGLGDRGTSPLREEPHSGKST